MPRRAAVLAAVVALAVVPAARAASNDSLAPPTAPPHWLPPEAWVYDHWLPFDESRLYDLLGVTRNAVWQQLRDDTHNLAELAARHGRPDAGRLASELVAPWRGRVPARRVAELRRRALLTLTQGHLSQHLLFHSLHQFAIPSAAPELFGLGDAAFRAQRRDLELSPLTIARLHGRSPGQVEALAAAVLRERVSAGVDGRAMSRRQGALLLRRQLSQLPRWLNQARYNGPPKTHEGRLLARPRDYASNPSITANGREVVYERYRQRLPQALALGEIAVVARDVRSGAGRPVSRAHAPTPDGATRPTSAYDATASADGRWVAYESAAGNRNFAKRYGRIAVLLADTRTGRTRGVRRPARGERLSQSLYNPVLSADGSALAFQGVDAAGAARVFVRRVPDGPTAMASTGLPAAPRGATVSTYEPAISADGRRVAFTVVTTDAAGGGRTSSRVLVRDVAAHRTVALTASSAFASAPALSGDGRTLAFAAADGVRGMPRLVVRDLRTGRRRVVSDPGEGAVVEPQLSRDGRRVAYTAVRGGGSVVVWRDLRTGARRVVSAGFATSPSLSGDGRRIAFASDATPDGTRGVFVADARGGAPRLMSLPDGPPAPHVRQVALVTLASPALGAPVPPRGDVTIADNAFAAERGERPTVTVARGATVTWAWRSQSSHNVTVRSGPVRFAAATRTAGGHFSRRLTRPGTYRIVCTIHSPGMRMTVVVR